VVRALENQTAVSNKIFTLKCFVSGYPISTVSWLRGQILTHELYKYQLLLQYTVKMNLVNYFNLPYYYFLYTYYLNEASSLLVKQLQVGGD